MADSYETLLKKQAQLDRVLELAPNDKFSLGVAQQELQKAQLDYGKQVVSSGDYSTPQAQAAASAFQALQAADKAKQEQAAAQSQTYTPQSNAAQYFNPNAGKLLGYIYDNSNSRERWSDLRTITIEGGEGSRTETEYAQPDRTVTKHYSDSVAIPIYEPPLKFVWDGKPLTDEQKFNLTAKLAGAGDVEMPGKVSGGPGGGTIDSPYVPLGMREAIGLPRSFDMLTNIDPSKPDWNLQKARLYNPTSKGVLGDFFSDFALPIQIAMMAAGVPPEVAGAIAGGTSAMNNDGNILKGALKGAAMGSAAQALNAGLNALGTAIAPGALTTAEAAIDAGTLGGQASGIAGLVNDLSSATGLSPSTLQNMAKGATVSAIKGGDPLEGMMSALASSGVTSAVSGMEGFSSLDPMLQKTMLSMASGATKAAISGGDIGSAMLQGGLGSLASSIGKMPREYSTPTESWIDQGGLDLGTEYSTPTESWIDSGDLGGAYSTATEDWIDKAGLVTQFQQPTLEELLNEPQTPTERAIDTGTLGNAIDYATPTESFIDQGGLFAPREYATPTESWIDEGGLGQPLTPADYATPTEDYIDRGGLGGAESTATEDYIDRGGLGGGSPTSGTTGGTTGGGRPSGGGTTPGTSPATTPATASGSSSDLLALLGLLGQQQAPQQAPQIPLVGEIKPYQFSNDLLEGVYLPNRARGSSSDLLGMLRG